MRTMIVIPCLDSVPTPFCQSLAMMNKTGEVALAMRTSSLVYDSRNQLARMAIEAKADRVLWLDSDMVFPSDLLTRMSDTMDAKGIKMLTGLYFRRNPPHTPVLMDELTVDEAGKPSFKDTAHIPDGLFQVAGCGFGCVMMDLDVLMAVALDNEGHLFDPMPGVGEDLAFCLRARRIGYEIICDPSIPLGHVGHQTITRNYWEAYEEARHVAES